MVNKAVRQAFRHSRVLQLALLMMVVLATAMVVGDGILTPSISVLSAVSGLQVATDNISPDAITGISVAVLVILFVSQRYGTSIVGHAFAPIVVIWLSMNAGVGIHSLATYGGEIFASLNPWKIVDFFVRNGEHGWLVLGGVILCITGAEAMYSDLGHFNRRAVSLGFISFVYPCLMLTYWGQGAYLLHHPEHVHDTFWKSVPDAMFWPMFVVAILASIVASQALISGAFSNMRQASMLGLFPKMTIIHTGHEVEGQIYMPEVNYALMVLCIAVTAGFQSTDHLGEAYGVAVMSVMTMTTLLVALVMLMTWNLHPAIVALFLCVYLPLEGACLSATLVKIPSGGWVAILVAVILSSIKLTWWWGSSKRRQYTVNNQVKLCNLLREMVEPDDNSTGKQHNSDNELNIMAFPKRQLSLVHSGEAVVRLPGLGIYYAEGRTGVPAVMRHVLANMPALYSSMVFLTVRFVALPTVDAEERFLVCRDKSLSSCYQAVVRYGYTDRINHGKSFMDALVMDLLRHLLERKGVGSQGAAQRLLAAITAKAAEATGNDELAAVKLAAAPGGINLSQASAAAAAFDFVKAPVPADKGVVASLLAGLSIGDFLAILQPPAAVQGSSMGTSRCKSIIGPQEANPAMVAVKLATMGQQSTDVKQDLIGTALEQPENGTDDSQAARASAQLPARQSETADGENNNNSPPTRMPSYWMYLKGSHVGSEDDAKSEGHEHEADITDSAAGLAVACKGTGGYADKQSAAEAAGAGSILSAAATERKSVAWTFGGTTSNGNDMKSADGIIGRASSTDSSPPSLSAAQVTALREAVRLLEDYQLRWVHCIGRAALKVLPGGSIAHRVLLGGLYRFLSDNSRQVTAAWSIPTSNLIELGMDIEI
eukprot:GHRR01016888.1.p1 GENE.GHRR01016888.1~~GHRR01016888.1.p1  ORF type:complete len:883 (+),score=297.21 GHRR01016888.1:1137-3785(+)